MTMADTLTRQQRSFCMSQIKAKGTVPELCVRGLVHSLGFRFRLHRRQLAGCPDLVFPKLHAVIFVHGCFWHSHRCRRGRKPKSNVCYWTEKLMRNAARDRANLRKLRRDGWRVLVVWECQTNNTEKLRSNVLRFLEWDRGEEMRHSP